MSAGRGPTRSSTGEFPGPPEVPGPATLLLNFGEGQGEAMFPLPAARAGDWKGCSVFRR